MQHPAKFSRPAKPETELDGLRRLLAEQTARADRAEARGRVLEAALADIHERIMRTLVEIRELGE